MAENWKTYKFEELYSTPSRNGLTKPKRVRGEGYKMVNMGELFAYSFIGSQSMDRVPLSERELANSLLLDGDLLFARQSLVEAGVGKCSLVNNLSEPTTFESHIIRVRPDKAKSDSVYLYYLFQSRDLRHQIMSLANGVAAFGIRGSDISAMQFKLPPLPEQRAIASILSALDGKIALNLQMNKTLEEMAMTLYKHWFVDFGPFKNGKFIDSELGLIPEGWEVKRLGDFSKNKQYGYTQSSSMEKIGPKFLRITDIQGGTVEWNNVPYCLIGSKDLEKYKIQKGDLFIARTGNSTGENTFVLEAPNAVFASYLIRFQFDDLEDATYVAKIFRSTQFFNFVEGAKGGSAQPGISAGTLSEFKLLIPPIDIRKAFFELISNSDVKKDANLSENQTLTNLRDTLLPKLISGEVRVKDMEKTIAEAL
jgi:type I restriction enzyme S subunit